MSKSKRSIRHDVSASEDPQALLGDEGKDGTIVNEEESFVSDADLITPLSTPAPVVKAEKKPPTNRRVLHIVEIRDDEGHLLCCYNAQTKHIEIKPKESKSTYSFSVDQLVGIGMRNILSNEPILEISAEKGA